MIKVFLDLQPTFRFLKKLQARLKNQSILMDEIGDYWEGRVLEGFRKETDPYGKKWKPLSPATIAAKERKNYPRNILVASGNMKRKLKITVKRKSVRIQIGFPSRFHQRGTPRIPQRKIIPENQIPKRDLRNIQDIIIDYLDIK